MANTNITIQMDEDLKRKAEMLFDDMGMNIAVAFTIFTKTVIRQGKIPFEIVADPFYSEINQARLHDAIVGLEAGQGIVRKTMVELEAMEDA